MRGTPSRFRQVKLLLAVDETLLQFMLMLSGALPENGRWGRSEDSMSVVAILSVVGAAFVLLSLGGLAVLMRKFNRIYDGLE